MKDLEPYMNNLFNELQDVNKDLEVGRSLQNTYNKYGQRCFFFIYYLSKMIHFLHLDGNESRFPYL